VGIILILVLLVVIFLIPVDTKKRKDKKKRGVQEDMKDWKKTALRLEKLVHSLKRQMEGLERKNKALDKRATMEKYINKKLQEKLAKEKDWHKKNESNIDKNAKELQELKQELINVQENSANEHSEKLKLRQDYQDLEAKLSDVNAQRRTAESENIHLHDKNDQYRMEIARLKKENAELLKKKDDTSWVAKSEYLRVQKLLQEKEAEISRIMREIDKSR
jgi:chromosome segregation ATPase